MRLAPIVACGALLVAGVVGGYVVGAGRSDDPQATVVSTVVSTVAAPAPSAATVTVTAPPVDASCIVTAYLTNTATEAEVEELMRRLLVLRAGQRIESFEYVSKEVALQRMIDRLGEDSPILDLVNGNPLPASFEVHVTPHESAEGIARELAGSPGLQPDRPGQPNPVHGDAAQPGEPGC